MHSPFSMSVMRTSIYDDVRSLVRDEHLTQQLFVKLATALSRYEPGSVAFSAWILRVARNLALDQVRARDAVPYAEVRPRAPPPVKTAARTDAPSSR
jgi:DNA-directed RNA polymerase specialized sigma24 family protein